MSIKEKMDMMKYKEAEHRGIGGVCRVCIYDGSMGYPIITVVIDWISKAVANSICKHMNKQIPDGLDIYYYTENRDDMEPQLSHWA